MYLYLTALFILILANPSKCFTLQNPKKQHLKVSYLSSTTTQCEELRTDTQLKKGLVIRNLDVNDIASGEVLDMCKEEYMYYGDISDLMDYINLFWFSVVIQFVLFQRIFTAGHNVICLEYNTKLIGMAEVSEQPFSPECTSPSFAIPLPLKRLSDNNLKAYLSNVLIRPEYRRRGYGNILMEACESLASKLGYVDLYLHVEAVSLAAEPARSLYSNLGYTPCSVSNSEYSKNEISLERQQQLQTEVLYFIEGLPMLCLRKHLTNN